MNDTILFIAQGLLAIPTGFLVESLKNAGMESKYAFAASAVIGASLGVLAAFLTPDLEIVVGFFGGLFAGAIASGFYSGGKAVRQ